jgi:hypothetical protein
MQARMPRESAKAYAPKSRSAAARPPTASYAAKEAGIPDAAKRRRSYAQGACENANKLGWAVQVQHSESEHVPPGEGTREC